MVDRIEKLEPLINLVKEQQTVISDQSVQITTMESKFAQETKHLKEKIDSLEKCVNRCEKSTVHNSDMDHRVSVLQEKLEKVNLSKCDTMRSLKDKQEYLRQEVASLSPTFEKQTMALQSQIQSLESDCVTHKRLLDDLQNRVASSLKCPQPNVSTIVTTPSPGASPSLPKCRLCGNNNHNSSTCGAQWLKCRQCGQVGHLARCCSVKQCQRCGLHSHNTEQCKGSSIQCWTCGQAGHLQRMCYSQVDLNISGTVSFLICFYSGFKYCFN